jgi:hypothetical protein
VTARGCLVLAATLCALLTACGGGGDAGLPEFKQPSAETDTPGRLPTPTPTESFGQANPVDAYRGFMQAVQIAVGTGDANYPGLTQYGEGGVLEYWRDRVGQLAKSNEVILGPLNIKPGIESRSADKAVISDCTDDREWRRYNRATGEAIAGKDPKPPLFVRAEVFRAKGIWKVRDIYDFGRGKGPCAGT